MSQSFFFFSFLISVEICIFTGSFNRLDSIEFNVLFNKIITMIAHSHWAEDGTKLFIERVRISNLLQLILFGNETNEQTINMFPERTFQIS